MGQETAHTKNLRCQPYYLAPCVRTGWGWRTWLAVGPSFLRPCQCEGLNVGEGPDLADDNITLTFTFYAQSSLNQASLSSFCPCPSGMFCPHFSYDPLSPLLLQSPEAGSSLFLYNQAFRIALGLLVLMRTVMEDSWIGVSFFDRGGLTESSHGIKA